MIGPQAPSRCDVNMRAFFVRLRRSSLMLRLCLLGFILRQRAHRIRRFHRRNAQFNQIVEPPPAWTLRLLAIPRLARDLLSLDGLQSGGFDGRTDNAHTSDIDANSIASENSRACR